MEEFIKSEISKSGLELTEGEIEVHSKVVTSPINSDGTFILKNIPVGKHEIFIKDTTGNVINEGEFTLQTGDKTTIENNIVTVNSNGNVELNIEITENSRLLADLKLNSLDLVNLVCEVEDEFDIEIPDKKLKSLITIKDVIDFIESQK